MTVTKVEDFTNKKHQVTFVVVTFSGPLNATQANEPGIYRLITPGKKGSYTAKNASRTAMSDSRDTGIGVSSEYASNPC